MSTKEQTQFSVGEKIVYPSQGLGIIKEIVERDFKGEVKLYYTIYIEVSDMTVLAPVEKSIELGIRSIVSAKEAEGALQLLCEAGEPNPTDWKMRYQMNMELLKKGTVLDIAAIVRSLYNRSKVKELPILERKLYESALKLVQEELACALEKPKEEIERLIHEKLESA